MSLVKQSIRFIVIILWVRLSENQVEIIDLHGKYPVILKIYKYIVGFAQND